MDVLEWEKEEEEEEVGKMGKYELVGTLDGKLHTTTSPALL